MPLTCLVFGDVTVQNSLVGWWQRLDSTDRRIVARQDRPFDSPRPWWLRYSVAWALPFVLSMSFARTYGGAWWIGVLLSAALVLVTLVLVSRWTRDHRLRKEEFETATDRRV